MLREGFAIVLTGVLNLVCQSNVQLISGDFDMLIKGGSFVSVIIIAIKYLIGKNSTLTGDNKELNEKIIEMYSSRIKLLEDKVDKYEKDLLEMRTKMAEKDFTIRALEGK